MPFDISSKRELAKLLKVAPQELDLVLRARGRYYRSARIPKRDGNYRTLSVPSGKLKLLQHKIKNHVLDQTAWLGCVHGGIRGRSVLTNARPHVGKPLVLTLDVRDCFPSVGCARVSRIFRSLGFEGQAVVILTQATTWKNQLPQGAPTSTSIANLALLGVDRRLLGLAREHGFSYTRHIDDLSLSGPPWLENFLPVILRILVSEGFHAKTEKTAAMPASGRQIVTKLVVNERVNLSREHRTAIKRELVTLSRHGGDGDAASAYGKLAYIFFVNPDVGGRLRTKLEGQP